MKYYAIVIGRVPGIYTDWPTAQKQISGYPGALYKSFSTLAEAEAFIQKSTISTAPMESPLENSLPDKTVIYTDGSYKDMTCGFGVAILASNGDKYTAYGRVPIAPPSNNVAELYAIYVALSLVQGDIILYTDSRYSISSLTTYIHDWLAKGWVGVANSELIYSIYLQMQNRRVDLRYVPGHAGYTLNEEVDRLAEAGRLQPEALVLLKNGVRQ